MSSTRGQDNRGQTGKYWVLADRRPGRARNEDNAAACGTTFSRSEIERCCSASVGGSIFVGATDAPCFVLLEKIMSAIVDGSCWRKSMGYIIHMYKL